MLRTVALQPKTGRPFIAAADSTISARLRAETNDEHQAIERNRRLHRLTEEDLGIDEYVSILARIAGFFAPVEEGLRRWSDRFPPTIDIGARLIKTELLRRDIAALAPDFDWEATTRAVGPSLGLATLEAAWGRLYVVEGATMGGQILARSLGAKFGLTPERGVAFYASYGPQTGARWQTFKAALNASVARGGLDADEIVAAARATFEAMNEWMDGGQ